MPFTNKPVTTGIEIASYEWLKEFWFALRERGLATSFFFPPQSFTWGQGIIPPGITSTSFTDPNANDGNGWDNLHNFDNPWKKTIDFVASLISDWYLMIDSCDQTQVIKTRITDWTANTLNFSSIQDYVTSGYISSISSLVGRKYYFIDGSRGVTWAERLLDFPNDYEYASGSVTTSTTTTLTDTTQEWGNNQFVGYDLLCYASDGFLKRLNISSNTNKILTFSNSQLWTPQGFYCIVKHNGKAYPGKDRVDPFIWYNGVMDVEQGHFPENIGGSYIHPINIPAISVVHGDFGLLGCADEAHPAFDIDYHTDFSPSFDQILCGYPVDKFFAKNFWKSLRALQVGCESLATSFVEKKSYEGSGSIPFMNSATFFKAANINAATTSITSLDGSGGANVAAMNWPYYPIDLNYSISNSKGEPYNWGIVTATSSTHIGGGSGGAWLHDTSPGGIDDVGKTMVISPGWTRNLPREVERMFYDKTCFLPDSFVDPDTSAVTIYDPAIVVNVHDSCFGVGRWELRAKSTKYIEHAKLGPQQGDTFVTGELARYVGNNWNDPITGIPEIIDYIDHFYTGLFPDSIQSQINQQMSGTATSGTSTQLTDISKDWWDNKWYNPNPNAHIEGYLGGPGSSTTVLIDPTRTSDVSSCFWATGRFTNLSPYVGFTIEVLISGFSFTDPNAVIEKRLITETDNTQVLINWSDPLSVSCEGKAYRIREPRSYELNRFKDRKLVITKNDGTKVTATILGNDDTTLFFDNLGFAVTAGMQYVIAEEEIGGVYKRSPTGWTKVAGHDTTRKFVPTPNDFVPFSPGNLPTYKTKYGRLMRGDDITTIFDEILKGLKALVYTRTDISWIDDIGFGPVLNTKSGSGGNEEDWPHNVDRDCCGVHSHPTDEEAWGEMFKVAIQGNDYPFVGDPCGDFGCDQGNPPWSYVAGGDKGPGYVGNIATSAGGQAPFCFGAGALNGAPGGNCNVSRLFSYSVASVSQPHCPLANALDFYAYTQIDLSDHDNGEVDCFTLPGDTEPEAWSEWHFDPCGDNVIFRKFHKFGGSGASTDVTRYGGPLGVNSLATPPPIPPVPGSCGSNPFIFRNSYAGYIVTQQYAVVKWDVPGGFTYV